MSQRPTREMGVVLCLASTSGSLAAASLTRLEEKHDLGILEQLGAGEIAPE